MKCIHFQPSIRLTLCLIPLPLLFGISQCQDDGDGDGWTTEQGDCDDADPNAHPGATEIWNDCKDFDCDGVDFSVGNGKDGDLVVSAGETHVVTPTATSLSDSAAAGSTSVLVTSSMGFSKGDIILIRTRASADTTQVGTYEMAEISSISGGTVTLASALQHAYSVSDGASVIRAFQWSSVEVGEASRITTGSWDGDAGGVLPMLVQGSVIITGGSSIDITATGYLGGNRSTSATQVGQQGESQLGLGTASTQANLTGGGGGSAPSLAHADGGGGGYGSAGATGGAYSGYSTTPGAGGSTWGDAELSTLHFGGAGGAGGLDADPGASAYGGAGGAGGGALVMIASELILEGTIGANGGIGENGQIDGGASPGGGGGGAGGSIFLSVKTAPDPVGSVSAVGGGGGQGSEAGSAITYGGAGGEGRIRIESPASIPSSPAAQTSCSPTKTQNPLSR